MLQNELNRVEDLLATSRAERDEIGIKYNALSEKVRDLHSSTSILNSCMSNFIIVQSLYINSQLKVSATC